MEGENDFSFRDVIEPCSRFARNIWGTTKPFAKINLEVKTLVTN